MLFKYGNWELSNGSPELPMDFDRFCNIRSYDVHDVYLIERYSNLLSYQGGDNWFVRNESRKIAKFHPIIFAGNCRSEENR